MMYKNSIKLIFSNFSLVWKLLVYFIVCLFLCAGLIYAVNVPIFNKIGLMTILSDIPDLFRNLLESFDFTQFFIAIEALVDSIVLLITSNFYNIWYYLLICIVVSIVVPYMIFNFYHLSTSNVLHNYMGSNLNFGFTASLFLNFWKNIRYILLSSLIILPLKAMTYFLIIKSFIMFTSNNLLVAILAPFIILAMYVILTSIRLAIFSGWVPCMVVKNAGVVPSLYNGFKSIRKRLPRIFASAIGVIITIMLVNVLGVFTFGVSLVITLPASYLLIATYNMVCFYTSTGLRFYVDSNNVFAPKKSEMVENFKIYKNLI